MLDQIGGGTHQNEKLSLVFRAVDHHAQQAENLVYGLDSINDHETSQRAKHKLWVLEEV